MTDRGNPSTKPAANGVTALPAATNPAYPATKLQLHSAPRPAYRPQPPPSRRHSRGCCCSCCLWMTLVIIAVLLLAAIAGAAFYVLYRPTGPSFSVASLLLSRFNLTDTVAASALNVTLVALNRNSKITFIYERISVRVLSVGVEIGDGNFPAFTHGAKNATSLRGVISRPNRPFPDGTDVSALRSSVRRNKLPIEIELETKVRAKIGNVKTKGVVIRVTCDGIRVSIPTGKTASVATTSTAKCKVDPRIKIIRWTV